MKHSGKARKAAFKMLVITLALVILLPVVGLLGWVIGSLMIAVSVFIFLVGRFRGLYALFLP